MIRKKTMRWIVSASMAAVVSLVGLTVYQVEKNQQGQIESQEQAKTEENVHLGGNHSAAEDESPHHSIIADEEEEIPTAETAGNQVKAKESENSTAPSHENGDTATQENASNTASSTNASAIVPEVNFTEDTLLGWPVEGTVIMDYSMDHTVYFPTLDVYKYNPSVLFGAEVGQTVEAAANGKVVKIEDTVETGTTITTDLGNGYQAVYGQLKDVLVEKGDVVSAGTVLGYINEPSRFYTEEGSNLYFAMTKDGKSIDPILYLP